MGDFHYLSGEDVMDLIDIGAFVDAVRSAYDERGNGAPAKPRTTLPSPTDPGILTGYLAILPEAGYMGGYTYAAGFGGEDAWFVTPLFDAQSGELRAIIDGAAMNPFKTGAAGAVGVDALARPDARTLGVIGSGSQAWGQVLATASVRSFEEILVYSPTQSHREQFAEKLGERVDLTVRVLETPSTIVSLADVLITATTASEPVFDGEDLEAGTHVTAMGQYHPDKREVDATTIARSRYVPDLRERVFQDAGAFLHALEQGDINEDHIHAELGEVVAEEAPGRQSRDEITLFDSGGTAIETVAAAAYLYEQAREQDRGTRLDTSPASEAFPW